MRTLDPGERERVEEMRRDRMRALKISVGFLLASLLVLTLVLSQFERKPLVFKLFLSVVVLVQGLSIWSERRAVGQLATDLEQAAVYSLEAPLESKSRRQLKRGVIYLVEVSGQRFEVTLVQYDSVAVGAPCTVEFLPASRLVLSVNGSRRWR